MALRHPQEDTPAWRDRAPALRDEVARLLKEEIDPLEPPGRPKHGATVVSRNDQRGTADDIVARLKRDDPDLVERVVNGEITPNAAARQKGWRKPRIVVSNPGSVARALRKHMKPDDLAELIRILTDDSS